MALKLGELNVILKADDDRLKRGLNEGERDVRRSGQHMQASAAAAAVAMATSIAAAGSKGGDGLIKNLDGKVKEARGRFAAAGDESAAGFLGGLGGKLTAGMPDVFSKVSGPMSAGVVALAPVIAAGMSSAVLLGLGGGVLALGVQQALQDPKVAAAWSTFGERAKSSLAGFTDAFKGPVARAAGTFGDSMGRMGPAFTRIGQTMGPIIDKLAPALASMAEKAMPGIEKAITASAPLFDKLAEHMPKIGDALSSFFDSIAKSGPGAVIFIDMVMTLFGGLIRFWGNGIEFWANTLEVLNTFFTEKVPAAFQWLVDKIGAGVGWITKKWDGLVGFFKGMPGRISRAARGMWDGLTNGAKGALNWLIRAWNRLDFGIHVSVPGWVPGIGGKGFHVNDVIPDIPMLAKGGHITGAGTALVGERGPELVHLNRGATVEPLGRGGQQQVVVKGEILVRGDGILTGLRERIAINGGNVQAVLGSYN